MMVIGVTINIMEKVRNNGTGVKSNIKVISLKAKRLEKVFSLMMEIDTRETLLKVSSTVLVNIILLIQEKLTLGSSPITICMDKVEWNGQMVIPMLVNLLTEPSMVLESFHTIMVMSMRVNGKTMEDMDKVSTTPLKLDKQE